MENSHTSQFKSPSSYHPKTAPSNKAKPPADLSTPLQYLKGVGPRLAEVFSKKNILTLKDLIHWYPRIYRDQRIIEDFTSLQPGHYVTLYGTVANKKVFYPRWKKKSKGIYEMAVQTKGGVIFCKYFRLPYRGYFDNLRIDQKVKVTGRVTFFKNRPELHHPDIYPFQPGEKKEDMLVPIYPEMESLSQHKIRNIVSTAFEALKHNSEFLNSDPLPPWLKEKYQLTELALAIKQIHRPDLKFIDDYLKFHSPAQKRLIFDEFFFLQLYLSMQKAGLKKQKAQAIPQASSLSEKLILPFQLTKAQKRVLSEIQGDLKQNFPMHRLVQGDVGSGKTIVALLICLQAIEHGFQCAFMAPTEILAAQHFKTALKWLKPLGIKISLLTGKTKQKEKTTLLNLMAAGHTNLCVGTHALIQEGVDFKNLGLVIIDEQHRFGVHQRSLLQKKGQSPHFLVMTATPIPRSLAMTLYGSLNVSVIDEMPPGRKPVVTKKTYSSRREKVLSFVESEMQKGRQAYVVYPLVEESEHVDLKNALQEYENLKNRFPRFQLGLLHGRLNSKEKQEVMDQFVKGDISLLVSTTVIEVGVDVPNATLMVVEHAERFGLSQLHQLRGRVGRGPHKSYCVLILGGGFSEEAKHRLHIMEQSTDGFQIAEEDLRLRGPGEFLGLRQSGLPEFKVASLTRDGKVLEMAKQAALQVITKDPHLKLTEHQALKTEMNKAAHRFLPG